MDIQNKHQKYSIILSESENIKVLINDIEVFNETVTEGFASIIQLIYNESKQ